MNRHREVIVEMVWLAILFCVSMFLCTYFFLWDTMRSSIDIHLHDTYYIIAVTHLVIPVFLFLTFLIFYLKEIIKGFRQTLPNIIVLVSGLLLAGCIVYTNHFLMNILLKNVNLGTSMYLSDVVIEDPAEISDVLTTAFTIAQLTITIGLIYMGYRWGRAIVSKVNR